MLHGRVTCECLNEAHHADGVAAVPGEPWQVDLGDGPQVVAVRGARVAPCQP